MSKTEKKKLRSCKSPHYHTPFYGKTFGARFREAFGRSIFYYAETFDKPFQCESCGFSLRVPKALVIWKFLVSILCFPIIASISVLFASFDMLFTIYAALAMLFPAFAFLFLIPAILAAHAVWQEAEADSERRRSFWNWYRDNQRTIMGRIVRAVIMLFNWLFIFGLKEFFL